MESKADIIPIFKNMSGKSLMIFAFPNKDEVINYQLQMLANNSIPGILKADTISVDGEIRLHYEITSLVSLKKLLERKRMGRKDILALINNIVNMIEGLDQYLLEAEKVLYESLYIYADPQDLKLCFTYLPIKNLNNDSCSIKSFLMDLIINDIQFTEERTDNFIQKLIEILKTEDFKVSSLKAYIKSMETDRQVNPVASQPAFVRPVSEEKIIKPPAEKPKARELIHKTVLSYPLKSYIVMGSVIAALLLFCLVLVISGIMSPSNPDSLLSLFGFLLIGGAVAYLVYTKMFTTDKKILKEAGDKNGQYVNKAFTVPIPSIAPITKKETLQAISYPMKEAAVSKTNSIAPILSSSTALASRSSDCKNTSVSRPRDKTVILDCGSLKLPHLKRTQGNSFETIIIKSFPFMMGRLEGQVDFYLNNPAVGKLHAEIKNTPEGFTVADMNSLNGTFVNGERVKTSIETLIKNGDKITLGNEEFVFYNE